MQPEFHFKNPYVLVGVIESKSSHLDCEILHVDDVVVEDLQVLTVQCLQLSKHVVHHQDGEQVTPHHNQAKFLLMELPT